MGIRFSYSLKKIRRSLNNSAKRYIIIFLALIISLTIFISLNGQVGYVNSAALTSTPIKNFNDIIEKMNIYYNPNIEYPYAETFSEKDTRSELFENSLGSYVDKCPTVGLDTNDIKNWMYTSEKALSKSCLVVNPKVKDIISQKHQELISTLTKETDQTFAYPGEDFYSGDGIVFVGGGSYSLMTFSVIKTIRESGTTLPIEVLIPTDEDSLNDEKFCNLIKRYNSKCIYLNRIFSRDLLENNEFKGFQYKSLALFASSFENVLLLDADDYPLKNLDTIFSHKVFREQGLILWPDFWRRTTNPFFYESAKVKVDTTRKIRNGLDTVSNLAKTLLKAGKKEDQPYHDYLGTISDPSSETGQMLLNKRMHWKTLLLSLYYNIYGPNVYYHLLSQYASGQGDKETFIAAAHVLHLPYYQIFSGASVDGYFTESGDFRGLAYYQKDYREDYTVKMRVEYERSSLTKVDNPVYVKQHYFSPDLSAEHSLFAHCNLPKFNPLQMAQDKEFTKNDQHFRGFTNAKSLGGLDLENIINLSFKELLCGKIDAFNYMFQKKEKKFICKYINERLELFQNEPLFN